MAVALAVLLFTGVLFSYLWSSVVHDGTEGGMEIGRRLWNKRCRSSRAFLVFMLPLRAIKIVVTVWQIISRGYRRCRPHKIAPEGRVRLHGHGVCIAQYHGSMQRHDDAVVTGMAYVDIVGKRLDE